MGENEVPVFETAEQVGEAIKANPNIFVKNETTENDFSEFSYAKDLGIVEDFDDDFKALKTPEERKGFIKTKLAEKFKNTSTEEEDDFVKEYKEAKKDPAFSKNKFLADRAKDLLRFEGKASDDIIREAYKENKYTDEEINEFLTTKSAIEKDHLANSIKTDFEKRKTQISEEDYNKQVEKSIQDISKNNSNIEKSVKLFIEKELKGNKYPIKFAEREIEEIQKDAIDFLKTEVVKGADGKYVSKSKFYEFLDNDEKMQLAIPFLTMIDKGTFGAFMKKFTMQVKDGEWNKLGDSNPIIHDQQKKGEFSYSDFQ